VRSGPLIARFAFVGVLAALVFASDGSGAPLRTVAITSTGPSPSVIRKGYSATLDFVNTDSVSHTVFFVGGHCTLVVPPGPPEIVGRYECLSQARPGTYHYLVDDRFRGTVEVAGLFRSVTVTARVHTIKLGSRVKLQGQLTLANQGAPLCSAYQLVVLVLARHTRSQPFKRIAMFPVGVPSQTKPAVNDRCTYAWQREVRPGLSTTYVARTFGGLYWWRPARSRPFTVQVRP
jgi:hypothetical protein